MKFDARIERLSEQLVFGLPLHLPLDQWTEPQIVRAAQREVVESLPTSVLKRLEAELVALVGKPPATDLTVVHGTGG
jgi:hypothetical protein